jgi:hypothetical protein
MVCFVLLARPDSLKKCLKGVGMSQESKITAEELAKAISEARGTDPNTTAKIEWLKEKWGNARYCNMGEETTMMHAILFMSSTPLHNAVLADNLSYFKRHYKHGAEYAELFLIEACLCGSRNVAEHLLATLKSNYKAFPDSLAYIAASMNTKWAKEVAHLLAKQKVPMVMDVYRLAEDPIADEIVGIFKAVASGSAEPASPSPFAAGRGPASTTAAPVLLSLNANVPSAPPSLPAAPRSSDPTVRK